MAYPGIQELYGGRRGLSSNNIKYEAAAALFQTAIVNVRNQETGELMPVRIFLDQGSSANFVTEDCAKRLKLKLNDDSAEITGLNQKGMTKIKKSTGFHIRSRTQEFSRWIQAYVTPSITGRMPGNTFDPAKYNWNHLKGLELADPNYNESTEVDVLIGVAHIGSMLRSGLRYSTKGPTAQESTLG